MLDTVSRCQGAVKLRRLQLRHPKRCHSCRCRSVPHWLPRAI